MRLLLAFAGVTLAMLPASAGAQTRRPPPAIEARIGTQVEWSYDRQPRGANYRFGDIRVEIRPRRDGGLIAPQVTVRNGRASATMLGSAVGGTFGHKLGVGILDRRGTRFVYFQSFSGGAHCCNRIQVALVRPGGIRVVDFENWDGDYGEMPRDVDGDGVVDFVHVDNAFLYAFSSYADSWAPPLIFNIIGDEAVDVSTRPSFRRLFQDSVNRTRGTCAPRPDRSPNGACAAYVASAARIGQFEAAWARMLRSYDRNMPACLGDSLLQLSRRAAHLPRPAGLYRALSGNRHGLCSAL
jgi:hypothetical protein